MTPCDSSLLKAYEWDESWTLTVVFRSNNTVRAYAEVPPEIFSEFEKAKSKGQFYNQHIKGKFESLKTGEVTDEEIATAVAEKSPADIVLDGISKMTMPDIQPLPQREDDTQISDDDIRAVDPQYKGGEPESIVETLSKTDNVGMSVPKASRGELEGLMAESATLVPVKPVIKTREDYVTVSDRLKRKMSVRDRLFGILDPVRKALWDALTVTRTQHGLILDPIDASIKADKDALVAWDSEQRRIAAVAQAAAQKAAEEAAAIEQAKRTDALRMQVAEEQAQAGDMDAAEATLFDDTIQAAPVAVYTPRVEPDTPAVAGMSTRRNWKIDRIDSLELLILDVAAGIESVRKTGNLQGHAPVTMLEPNMPALNKRAKADERTNLFPGVIAHNAPALSVRRGS